jgi:hypothetical protein
VAELADAQDFAVATSVENFSACIFAENIRDFIAPVGAIKSKS